MMGPEREGTMEICEGTSAEWPLPRPKHKRGSRYERLGLLQIEDVLPFIGGKPMYFVDHEVNMDTPPLKCFKAHGTKCQVCGLEAEYFAVEWDPLSGAASLMLVGTENGREVLFTRDHIRPLSMGGSKNGTKNLRTCCAHCNQLLGQLLTCQIHLMKRMGCDPEIEIKKLRDQKKKNLPKGKSRFLVTPPFGMTLGAFWPEEEGVGEGEEGRMEVEDDHGTDDA